MALELRALVAQRQVVEGQHDRREQRLFARGVDRLDAERELLHRFHVASLGERVHCGRLRAMAVTTGGSAGRREPSMRITRAT